MQAGILDGILAALPELRRRADPAFPFPETVDRPALEDLVSLVKVHIDQVQRDGVAYVGYQLRCAWDAEHG
jgi:hypothetical protein